MPQNNTISYKTVKGSRFSWNLGRDPAAPDPTEAQRIWDGRSIERAARVTRFPAPANEGDTVIFVRSDGTHVLCTFTKGSWVEVVTGDSVCEGLDVALDNLNGVPAAP